MSCTQDGPSSSLFAALTFEGNATLADLALFTISDEMAEALEHAPRGKCVAWGIPFRIEGVVAIADEVVAIDCAPTKARWFIFAHTSDQRPAKPDANGFTSPMHGQGQLGEHAADYVLLYQDGTEERLAIRRRHQLGTFRHIWGENCFQAVAHRKPFPVPPLAPPSWPYQSAGFGSQMRVRQMDGGEGTPPWINWLWAWDNPHPDKAIVGIRFEPVSGLVVVSAISVGNASSNPLRWRARQKA